MNEMSDECTRAEAMIFAVAVHDVVNTVNPVMPSMVIMEAATRVNFHSDDIPAQVRTIVADLIEEWPIKQPVGEHHDK